MDFYSPRKIVFKAWNREEKLLKRLDTIDCVKGELRKEGHVLLQFTGMFDQAGEEIYDLDVLLYQGIKVLVVWNETLSGWSVRNMSDGQLLSLRKQNLAVATRLCCYFESNP